MTLLAAKLLDTAWATFQAVSSAPDKSGLSDQTPSWLDPRTPYDFAALLVRSLLPATYNYPASSTEVTWTIWDDMVNCGEIVSIARVAELTDEFYDFRGLAEVNGQCVNIAPSQTFLSEVQL